MAYPDRVFLVVVETEDGHDPDRMPLLKRERDGRPQAPVFSSMQRATAFLSEAQELGYQVKLDYIFPVEASRLPADFPDHEFQLDPSPRAYFAGTL